MDERNEMDDLQDEGLVLLQDGKVMIRRQGTTLPLEEDWVTPDGIRVSIDGRVTMPDGVTRVLTEGETVNMRGSFSRVEDIMDNKLDDT